MALFCQCWDEAALADEDTVSLVYVIVPEQVLVLFRARTTSGVSQLLVFDCGTTFHPGFSDWDTP